jgi:hypothetical protein
MPTLRRLSRIARMLPPMLLMRVGGRIGVVGKYGAHLRLRAMRTLRRLIGVCRGPTFARGNVVAR